MVMLELTPFSALTRMPLVPVVAPLSRLQVMEIPLLFPNSLISSNQAPVSPLVVLWTIELEDVLAKRTASPPRSLLLIVKPDCPVPARKIAESAWLAALAVRE